MNDRLRWAVTCTLRGMLWAALAALVCGGAAVQAQVVHVEEDWELVIGEPDANSAGPQVTCSMSPYADISSTYFTTEINHRSVPWWAPGGISLHQWNGEARVRSFDRADRSVMQTSDEVVRWTQLLDVYNGVLTFQVKDGSSTTWGPFGYTSQVRVQTSWPATHVNSYLPEVSVANSGVAFAGNRVKSLTLKEVRYTLSTGTTVTDSTDRPVHVLTSP